MYDFQIIDHTNDWRWISMKERFENNTNDSTEQTLQKQHNAAQNLADQQMDAGNSTEMSKKQDGPNRPST
jgi:hypothetical protein